MSRAKRIYNVNLNTHPKKPHWANIIVNYQLNDKFLNQIIISGMTGERFRLDHYLKLGLPHDCHLDYISGILPMRFNYDGQITVHADRSSARSAAQSSSKMSQSARPASSSAKASTSASAASSSSNKTVDSASMQSSSSSESSENSHNDSSEEDSAAKSGANSDSSSISTSVKSSRTSSESASAGHSSSSSESDCPSSHASSVSSSQSAQQSHSHDHHRSEQFKNRNKVIPIKDTRDDISTVLMALGYSLGALGKSVDDLQRRHRSKL